MPLLLMWHHASLGHPALGSSECAPEVGRGHHSSALQCMPLQSPTLHVPMALPGVTVSPRAR